jgi:hypothetical protein
MNFLSSWFRFHFDGGEQIVVAVVVAREQVGAECRGGWFLRRLGRLRRRRLRGHGLRLGEQIVVVIVCKICEGMGM